MTKGQGTIDMRKLLGQEEDEPAPEESTPVKGSAVIADRTGSQDPSLDVLVARMQQMEQQIALQNQLLTALTGGTVPGIEALLDGKNTAVQGLEAAQEALQDLRERQPADPAVLPGVLAEMRRDLENQRQAKAALFRERLREAPDVKVRNDTGAPVQLMVNGIAVILEPGENTVKEPFARAWQDHIDMVLEGTTREGLIRGMLEFGQLEDWIHAGREE